MSQGTIARNNRSSTFAEALVLAYLGQPILSKKENETLQKYGIPKNNQDTVEKNVHSICVLYTFLPFMSLENLNVGVYWNSSNNRRVFLIPPLKVLFPPRNLFWEVLLKVPRILLCRKTALIFFYQIILKQSLILRCRPPESQRDPI